MAPFREDLESLMEGHDYRYQNQGATHEEPFHCGGIQAVTSTPASRALYKDIYLTCMKFLEEMADDRTLNIEGVFRMCLEKSIAGPLGLVQAPLPHRYGSLMPGQGTKLYHATNAGTTIFEKSAALQSASSISDCYDQYKAFGWDVGPGPLQIVMHGWACINTQSQTFYHVPPHSKKHRCEWKSLGTADQPSDGITNSWFPDTLEAFVIDQHSSPLAKHMPLLQSAINDSPDDILMYLVWGALPVGNHPLEGSPRERPKVVIACPSTGVFKVTDYYLASQWIPDKT